LIYELAVAGLLFPVVLYVCLAVWLSGCLLVLSVFTRES